MPIIHIVVKVVVTDLESFKGLAKRLEAGSRAEEGCVYYNFLQLDSADNWIIVEKWKSWEAVEYHNQTPHYTQLVPELLKVSTIEFLKRSVDMFEDVLPIIPEATTGVASSTKKIQLIVSVDVTNSDEFKLLASELTAESRKEDGCLGYTFAQVEGVDCTEFLFIETWRDEESLALHRESPHAKRLIPLLDGVSKVAFVLSA